MARVHDSNAARRALRAFLDAASAGDVAFVDAYIRAGGDVNAALGEGWTALHGAVTRGQVRVLERLLDEPSCDLNALTAVGTSALGMALRLGNQIVARVLLDGGASRATIAQEELRRAWDIARPELQRRLDPGWSIRWTTANHHRFSRQERAKCRLVLCMNHAAAAARTRPSDTMLRWEELFHEEQTAEEASTLARTVARALLWRLAPWSAPPASPAVAPGGGGPPPPGHCRRVAWVYLPPATLELVLQFALFLW